MEADYRETCLLNADSIAYMIQYHPEILGDVQEFRKIARMMEVDEIHIFEEGEIITGSHPEYYGFNFDTGEQIGFFRPMMEDKTLRLCQDITPNTAEGKLVQYSAVWSADGKYIVQVGMYPETVLEATEKNEMSHIFSLLQGNPGVDIYAIDSVSGEILGATTGGDLGRNWTEIGFRANDYEHSTRGMHIRVSGVDSFCVFTSMDDVYIGYVIPTDQLYSNIPIFTMILVLALTLIEAVMMLMMSRFTNKYIAGSINKTNEKLRAIADGNLDERVDVHTSLEFAELSQHINSMIRSLLAGTDKLGFILNRTNLHIGVYEYNENMKTVQYTDHVPAIFGLNAAEIAQLTGDHQLWKQYIELMRQEPVPGEENVFRVMGSKETYVRMEEIANGSARLGIVIDETEDIITRRTIESERDIDSLTGLYNRRALDREMERLFSSGQEIGHGALVMIDSDGLKTVNDVFGHANGDLYLKRLADVIRSFGSAKRLVARQSGDEFVILLYGYESESAVMADLEKIRDLQHNTTMIKSDGGEVQVRFSFGYVLTYGRRDYNAMLSEADSYMYAVKRKRKGTRQSES